MTAPNQRWTDLYHQTPLCDVPRQFANIANSAFLTQYPKTALRCCPRDVRAEGIDLT